MQLQLHASTRCHRLQPTKYRTHIWNDDGTLRLNGDLNDFEELRLTLMQSLSALLAFLPDTALGMPSSAAIPATLKLAIPMGRAVLFRFDWLHHGWKCVDERDLDALRVHFRAHFFLLSGVLRELLTVDLEATFEFLSALSHEDWDDATKLLLLECLETQPSARGFRCSPLNKGTNSLRHKTRFCSISSKPAVARDDVWVICLARAIALELPHKIKPNSSFHYSV